VGKSTLFNALTLAGAAVANYPFTTISPNVGIVPVPDRRLEHIAEIIRPERVVPATLRVVDIAGLVKGASQGEGLGNQFLSHIRDVDAIAMVVRCFQDANVPHVTPVLNPIEDIETIELELMLADLEILERQLERVKTRAKAHPQDFRAELATLELAMQSLREGSRVAQASLDEGQRAQLAEMALLTNKAQVYVANVSEDQLPDGGELAQRVRVRGEQDNTETVVLSAQLEAELATWEAQEAADYRQGLGLATSGLQTLIEVGYRLLDYVTFFTTTGGKEVRAWTLRRGQSVLQAAGTIHSDLERGFIRAEVVAYDDLARAGDIAHARQAGALRLEGRDYVVRDGDVIHIRFSV